MFDNQEAWEVCVYQGDDPNALNNLLVGRFRIEGLSRVPAGNEVLCRMELDLDGILRVSAIEKSTALTKRVTIEGATAAMSEAELAAARERMRELFGDVEGESAGNVEEELEETDPGERVLDGGDPAGVPDAARRRGGPGDDDQREQRVAVSEARALLERSERLQSRMTSEDREEAVALQRQIEDALKAADWERVHVQATELADLLFYVEER
jgi:hypothetical protein